MDDGPVTAAVFIFLAFALLGILWVYVPRWIKYWRDACEFQDDQIRDALAPGDFQRWEQEQP